MVKISKLFLSMIIMVGLIFVTGFLATPVSAQSTCGETYIIQPGDSLAEIADRCGTSVSALLSANPWITDPSLIFAGSVLTMPDGDNTQQPSIQISPLSGAPGSVVSVNGTGFPVNTTVMIGPGVAESEPVYTNSVITNSAGQFFVQLVIPADSADVGETWVVLANVPGMSARATAEFLVTSGDTGGIPIPPTGGSTYIVQSGDYLSSIANRYNTTVQAILQANPQITNPDLIYRGQVLVIPSGGTGGIPIPPTGETGYYIIQPGDTLTRIANRYNTSVNVLLQLNPQITNPNLIYRGLAIRVP